MARRRRVTKGEAEALGALMVLGAVVLFIGAVLAALGALLTSPIFLALATVAAIS